MSTKDKLLKEAEILFSQKGFYGTSINDVASQVSVSKQALLHHFSSKEKLYAAVLEKSSRQLVEIVMQSQQSSEDPSKQLSDFVQRMHSADEALLRVIILLLRELLDNRERAESAHKWYLRPFLDALVDIIKNGQSIGQFQGLPALAFIYQLLGAIQYYLISLPTLRKIYSQEEFADLQKTHLTLINRAH